MAAGEDPRRHDEQLARAGDGVVRAKADNPFRDGGGFGAVYDFTDPQTDTTRIPLTAFDDEDFRFAMQLAVPRLGPIGNTIRDGREGIFLVTEDDASWVEISPDTGNGSTVLYGGPACSGPTSLTPGIGGTTWAGPLPVRMS